MNFGKIDASIDPTEVRISKIEEMLNSANAKLLKVMENHDFPREWIDKAFSILDWIRNIDREIAMNKGNDNYINSKLLERKELLSELKNMLDILEKWYDDVYDANWYKIVRKGKYEWLADENSDLIKNKGWEPIFPFEYYDLSKVKGWNLLYMDKNWERWMKNIKWEILYKSKLHCWNLFNCAILFDNWRAAVKVEDWKYWLLNSKWELIDNVKYDYITNINWVEWIYKIWDKKCCGLIDKEGNVIYKPKKCYDISDFREINWKKVAVAMKFGEFWQDRWLISLDDNMVKELIRPKYVILEHERDNIYYYWKARFCRKDEYWYVDCFTWKEYKWKEKETLLKKWESEWYEPKNDIRITRIY